MTDGFYEERQVGQRIADLRKDRGLSQRKLAELIAARGEPYAKWRQSSVDKTEKGQRPLRVSEIFDLAAVLEVPPERLLFGWEFDSETLPGQIEEIEARLQTVRAAHQEARIRLQRARDQADKELSRAQADEREGAQQIERYKGELEALYRVRARLQAGEAR